MKTIVVEVSCSLDSSHMSDDAASGAERAAAGCHLAARGILGTLSRRSRNGFFLSLHSRRNVTSLIRQNRNLQQLYKSVAVEDRPRNLDLRCDMLSSYAQPSSCG